MKINYIWLILKILSSITVLYLLCLDTMLIIIYYNLEDTLVINNGESTNFYSELVNLLKFFIGFPLEPTTAIILPFIFVVTIILLISIILTILIFRKKNKVINIISIIFFGLFLFLILNINT